MAKIISLKWLAHWIPVLVFIFIAIAFHLHLTSKEDFYLLAGSDGPYFPVQVKSLITQQHLAFPDMLLLFVLGAMLAKLLYVLQLGSSDECILIAVRYIDAFLPPLAAIPVFFIAKMLSNQKFTKFQTTSYLLIAFSILSYTPLYVYAFQLQKNALATVLVFSYLYYLLKFMKDKRTADATKLLVILILCAMTHFGSFGLLLFLSFVIAIVWLFVEKQALNKNTLKIAFVLFLIFVLSLLLVRFFDNTRFLRIINVPFKIFEAPVILFALAGQNLVLNGPNLLILCAMHLLAILGLVFMAKKSNEMQSYQFILGIAFGICTLLLSNPFLGLEWASRLFMLAYIPVTVLYLIIYNVSTTRWIRLVTIPIFSLLLMFSIFITIFLKPPMAMDEEALNELKSIKNLHLLSKNDAIVARQSLRILSNWVLETKGIDKYLLSKSVFKQYNAVYLIRQIKGKNPLLRGVEPQIGASQTLVWKGTFFEIFKIMDDSELPELPQKIFKGVKGTIQSVIKDKILVIDYKSNMVRTVHLSTLDTTNLKLQQGMKVEINGEWRPFSLDINAETLKEIDGFDN